MTGFDAIPDYRRDGIRRCNAAALPELIDTFEQAFMRKLDEANAVGGEAAYARACLDYRREHGVTVADIPEPEPPTVTATVAPDSADRALARMQKTCDMTLRTWSEGGPPIVTLDEIRDAIAGKVTTRVGLALAADQTAAATGNTAAEPDDDPDAPTGLAEIESLLFASVQTAFREHWHDIVWEALRKTRAMLSTNPNAYASGSEHEQFKVVGPWGVDGATSAEDGWRNKDDHDRHYPRRAAECRVERRTVITFDNDAEFYGPWSQVPRPAPPPASE